MKSTYQQLLLLVLLSAVLTFSWFSAGRIIASGESAIPFYNFSYLLYSSAFTWTPSALGFPSSFTLVGVPFFLMNYLLSQLFKSDYLIQGTQFFLLFLTSGIVIYRYTSQHTKHFTFISFATLFYLLNLFIIPNLWGRLQYPYLYFYAFLPLGFYIISKALDERKKISIFLFIVLTFLFSLAFASIPLLELFWMIQGLYLVFFLIIHHKDREKLLYAVILFFGFLIGWIVVNFWWFYQFFIVLTSTTYITGFYSIGGNTTTLLVLSERLGNLSYVFRLMHKDFFTAISDVWGPFYMTPFAILLSYVLPFFAFGPLLVKRKPKIIYFFLGLSLLITFLMKGSSEPFGVVSLFVFTHVRFLEAFRNAFEKFGLALPFAYAPLIGYTSYLLFEFIKKKYNKPIATSSITFLGFLIFGVLIFPMWNKWVYSSTIPPANNLKIGDYVVVPEYYEKANAWLKSDTSEFRNVALPIGGEGITYTWSYGYSGVELSNSLFDKPFISLSTTIQFLDNIASQIEETLFTSPQHFSKLLSLVGAKYVMTRTDIDYEFRNMTDPQLLESYIQASIHDKKLSLTPEKTFAALRFYENSEFIPMISPAKNIYVVEPTLSFSDAITSTGFQTGDAFINTLDNPVFDNKSDNDARSRVLSPDISFTYGEQKSMNLDEVYKGLPYIRFLPSSSFYSVIRVKESFDLAMESDAEKKFFHYLVLIDKRLVELRMSVQLKNPQNSTASVKNYIEEITAFQNFLNKNKPILIANLAHFRTRIENQQAVVERLLDEYANEGYSDVLQKAEHGITAFAKENYITPVYPVSRTFLSHGRAVSQFSIDHAGEYELFLTNPHLDRDFVLDQEASWQVNDKEEKHPVDYSSETVRLGIYTLKKGFNEVQFPLPEASNLLDENASDSGVLRTKNRVVVKKIQLRNIDRYADYIVSFSYKFEKGGCADIRIESIPEKVSLWKTGFGCYVKGTDWETKQIDFNLQGGYFTDAQIVISVDPKGKDTEFLYKDLSVAKQFPSTILLKHTNKNYKAPRIPSVTFTKVSPAKYQAHIVNASDPFYLVFLTSYHPLWKAKYTKDNSTVPEESHFLANSFANAWYLDKKGTYDMEITFIAEEYYMIGKIVSGAAIAISIGAILIYYIHKRKRKKH